MSARISSLAAIVLGLSGCANEPFLSQLSKTVSSDERPIQLAQARTQAAQPAVSPYLEAAPQLFEATGLAVWDGKRTLQGVWVAHPLATSARRVRIFNQSNGQAVDGALFKRDAALEGASVLISSEAAQLLGMEVGTPAELRIVAVRPVQRRDDETTTAEVQPEDQTDTPVSNETVASGEQKPELPVPQTGQAGAAQSEDSQSATWTRSDEDDSPLPQKSDDDDSTGPVAISPAPSPKAPKTEEAPQVAPADEQPVAQKPADPEPQTAARSNLRLPFIQAGLFGVRQNATRLISRLRKKGIPAEGRKIRSKGRVLTKVLAGPFQSTAERGAALREIRRMGLRDATPVRR